MKVLSIIGIILSVLFLALSAWALSFRHFSYGSYYCSSDEVNMMGGFGLIISLYLLSLSIVGVVKSSKRAA